MGRKLVFAIASALLVLLSTGCVLTVEPETAVNPVGTEHTVTATLQLRDLDSPCDVLPEVCPAGVEQQLESAQADEPRLLFEVISGPNAGADSDHDGECEGCLFDEATEEDKLDAAWTYQSNGTPGTDLIRVCSVESETAEETFEEMERLLEQLLFILNSNSQEELTMEELFDQINEEFDTDHEDVEDILCETVSKTWVNSREGNQRPNIGAGLSGLFAGQPTPLPTAAAPAPAAPSPVIRPPSTGDGGLAE